MSPVLRSRRTPAHPSSTASAAAPDPDAVSALRRLQTLSDRCRGPVADDAAAPDPDPGPGPDQESAAPAPPA
ncbi:hypothetical protein, partial [Streptomonospora salina]